jgi:hypothetical protein
MARIETPKTYEWEGKQDRYWYRAKWSAYYQFTDYDTAPKAIESVRGTVTRVTDTKSEHFNRWFAQLHLPPIKSEPMLSRYSAMRWLEVIERMNR